MRKSQTTANDVTTAFECAPTHACPSHAAASHASSSGKDGRDEGAGPATLTPAKTIPLAVHRHWTAESSITFGDKARSLAERAKLMTVVRIRVALKMKRGSSSRVRSWNSCCNCSRAATRKTLHMPYWFFVPSSNMLNISATDIPAPITRKTPRIAQPIRLHTCDWLGSSVPDDSVPAASGTDAMVVAPIPEVSTSSDKDNKKTVSFVRASRAAE
mmetsp:Transcript_62734/g.163007  ORF Transcript_62734/g.163007 Transcript_62734/m.163007 type:complete len:215 (+) Transcript_62734:46-690(+)